MFLRNLLIPGLLIGLLFSLMPGLSWAGKDKGGSPYKVYVILGFHTNFYHSWRGDTPDEAGFGTDIRVVREILRTLDEANAKGQKARGYWEGESLFTFEDIVPKNAPDITLGIKRRIDAGQDEFMPAPYSNTLFHAVTEDEMRAVLRWAVSNPWGSGAKDLFGKYVPLIRPQEGMSTTGQMPILLQEGFKGLVLAYSSYSFTTFSNFVPLLPPEQRYNYTWLRDESSDTRGILFPCTSAADVVNYISIERWLLDLHKLQTTGEVKQDLVIHINFDADAETWVPMLPGALAKIPNAGGLQEYIRAVNKYNWAEFTVPGEYLASHEPVGEVVIKQDTADGGWDGSYSWAEKYPSHAIWSELERSRVYTARANALSSSGDEGLKSEAHRILYEGRDSSFFKRVTALSTTHFGMSTPMINEERQAVAEKIVASAKDLADMAERLLAEALAKKSGPFDADVLYAFRVTDARPAEKSAAGVFNLLRIPVLLKSAEQALALETDEGKDIPFSLVDLEEIEPGHVMACLLVPLKLMPGQSITLLLKTKGPAGKIVDKNILTDLHNDRIRLALDGDHGVKSLMMENEIFGDESLLSPFITYVSAKKPVTYHARGFTMESLAGERWQGIKRARLKTGIPFTTPDGEAAADVEITFTLPEDAAWLVADVAVSYPYTAKKDILHNLQQKLRRYLDLRWIEVAPFELHPIFSATREDPLRVWKHNYLGVTSSFDMDYARINPKNAEWDSMNHQVTAGWVAVTDKKKGLLTAVNADVLSSFAFMPMRLREESGRQKLSLNPFGSYYGKQEDYSHMGGNGVGSGIADIASSALRPNGPSYNGMREKFSLLIAPYTGDEPPASLQAEAQAFFYPPEVVYLNAPDGIRVRLRQDVERTAQEYRTAKARQKTGPLPAPLAFLVNPTEAAVDLVWDEPEDARIDGYEIEWHEVKGQGSQTIGMDRGRRYHVEGLTNGDKYAFRMRAAGLGLKSDWTPELTCTVGPVKNAGIAGAAKDLTPSLAFKTIYYELVHFFTTP